MARIVFDSVVAPVGFLIVSDDGKRRRLIQFEDDIAAVAEQTGWKPGDGFPLDWLVRCEGDLLATLDEYLA